MKSPVYNEWAREMSKAEMDQVSEAFAQTALNSKSPGLTGSNCTTPMAISTSSFSPMSLQ